MALVELSIVEQRYRAVLEAAAGVQVTEVAARHEMSRQSVHAWLARYWEGGLGALADRPRRPDTCPHQVSAEIEAAVCEMRDHGSARALRDQRDDEHLRARAARASARGGRRHG